MITGNDENLLIEMVEGDYGLTLPITLNVGNTVFGAEDHFSIRIFEELDGTPVVTKEYSNISDNTIDFSLTQEESNKLPKGRYYYDIDWFQGNSFLGNVVGKKVFKVLNKAGGVNGNNV